MSFKNESYITEQYEDDINLLDLAKIIISAKYILISITAVFSIIAVIYSLSLPNIYQSKALLVSNDANNNTTNFVKNSLANFAGIRIPTENFDSNPMKAIKKLNTLSFFETNIMPNIFLPDLMAYKSWNSKTNTSSYDDEKYDQSSNTWVREYKHPKTLIPSAQESFVFFKSKHVSISEDKLTGFVTVRVKHQNPNVAMQWTKLMIDEINNFYREKDRNEAQRAVDYLNAQISETKSTEIKQLIAALLQQETQKLTLVEANEYYVYEYIDPPAVMERKIEPRRSLICIVGAFLGMIIGIIFILIRHHRSKES